MLKTILTSHGGQLVNKTTPVTPDLKMTNTQEVISLTF